MMFPTALGIVTFLATTIVAAVVEPEVSILYAYGPMGVILSWFMLRGEKLAARVTKELTEMRETLLLDIMSRDTVSDFVRETVQSKLNAIQAGRKSDNAL